MVLFTATCEAGHPEATWTQTPGNVVASSFYVRCRACAVAAGRRPLGATLPAPQAIPAPAPLILRGYRWAKAVMGT